MDSDDLLRGALRALVNSASLVEAAAHLYQVGHDQGCLILAVSAREELGRAAMLATTAKSMTPGDHIWPATLRESLNNHEKKLRAGQTSFQVPMRQEWLEEWKTAVGANDPARLAELRPEYELIARSIRRREPQLSTITVDDSLGALMSVAAGVANTLIRLATDQTFSRVTTEVLPPHMGDFTTSVFSKISLRRGEPAAEPKAGRALR